MLTNTGEWWASCFFSPSLLPPSSSPCPHPAPSSCLLSDHPQGSQLPVGAASPAIMPATGEGGHRLLQFPQPQPGGRKLWNGTFSLEKLLPSTWGDPHNRGQGWDEIPREKKRKNIFSQSVDAKWNYFDRFSSPTLKGPEFLISDFTLRHEISPMTWQTITSTMLWGSSEASCHLDKVFSILLSCYCQITPYFRVFLISMHHTLLILPPRAENSVVWSCSSCSHIDISMAAYRQPGKKIMETTLGKCPLYWQAITTSILGDGENIT